MPSSCRKEHEAPHATQSMSLEPCTPKSSTPISSNVLQFYAPGSRRMSKGQLHSSPSGLASTNRNGRSPRLKPRASWAWGVAAAQAGGERKVRTGGRDGWGEPVGCSDHWLIAMKAEGGMEPMQACGACKRGAFASTARAPLPRRLPAQMTKKPGTLGFGHWDIGTLAHWGARYLIDERPGVCALVPQRRVVPVAKQ